jgi:hypothetical protein
MTEPPSPLRMLLSRHTRREDANAYLETTELLSRPEEFHLRALPEPCMTLSSHTAPDVRPLP